jgi:hypothetical protein
MYHKLYHHSETKHASSWAVDKTRSLEQKKIQMNTLREKNFITKLVFTAYKNRQFAFYCQSEQDFSQYRMYNPPPRVPTHWEQPFTW